MKRHEFMGPMWWHGRLRGSGYRITMPRQAILDVLHQTHDHLSAEDIYIEVRKDYPQIGLTTALPLTTTLSDSMVCATVARREADFFISLLKMIAIFITRR